MNAGKIAITVLGKHGEGFLLTPVTEEIPLEQARRQAFRSFSPFLDTGPAKLSVYTGSVIPRAGDGTELRVFSYLTRLLLGLGICALGNYLSCFLTYIEALHYPESAKTCKVQAGLECCITNNAQQYSFRRDVLLSVTV